ncbi:MAG: MFS transporter [Cryomorphaceae bacterium]|jgi:maltose/moltooligosaccharide transporter|nr:MFS transporter [Cryomorphaceae bacterium]
MASSTATGHSAAAMSPKKTLNFWQIWNMSFGFLGIQFGFALQGGFMSSIFQNLGASKDELPGLWIAAPLTGLIVQPIIGYLSDRTWSPRFGRRRPYFLVGAVLSTLALFFIPNSPTLWIAAGLLWVLDASINISMEPFRALVADKLPDEQRSYGFVAQTLIIGIGTWIASNLPWLMSTLGVSTTAPEGQIPPSVHWAFAVGAVVFLSSILWTVFRTTEEPPADMQAFRAHRQATAGLGGALREITGSFRHMPSVMWKLGLVQFFSWFAFFTMWNFAGPALAEHVYHAAMPEAGALNYLAEKAAYNDAAALVGSSMGLYGLSSMAFAFVLTVYTSKRALNRRMVHLASLAAGGLGFLLMPYATEANDGLLNVSFALIGVAWGSILSMPYAILSSEVDPSKMGITMGLFNMFIVIPQIVAAVGGINWAYKSLLGDAVINTMVLAGLSLLIGALSSLALPSQKG